MSGVRGQRFDEIDLVRVGEPVVDMPARELQPQDSSSQIAPAPLVNRALAFLTDVSLFLATALAMSPLLPLKASLLDTAIEAPAAAIALGGFLLLLSFYYSVLSWMFWGRTVGASIFDLRVRSQSGGPVDGRSAAMRWLGTLLCIATAGIGFLPALAGSRRSLADRISATRSVRSS